MIDGTSPITGVGPLAQAMATSASGLRAQATRLRIVAENLANVNSTAATPGGDPYQRKTVTFEQAVDKATGASLVVPGKIGADPAPFRTTYDPSHPADDAQGYVRTPNVNSFVEIMDMREAQRSYSANLNVMEVTRTMLTRTIELLK